MGDAEKQPKAPFKHIVIQESLNELEDKLNGVSDLIHNIRGDDGATKVEEHKPHLPLNEFLLTGPERIGKMIDMVASQRATLNELLF